MGRVSAIAKGSKTIPFFAIALGVIHCFAPYSYAGWATGAVSLAPANMGPQNVSIAVNGNRSLSICSLGENFTLRYTTYSSRRWTSTTLASSASNPIMKLDHHGRAHIAYIDYGNPSDPKIKYATNATGIWKIESVATGYGHSLDVDLNGMVHISYTGYDPTTGQPIGQQYPLKYATNASGKWEFDNVSSPRYQGQGNAIALDANGKVHICYVTDVDVIYTTNESGTWSGPLIVGSSMGGNPFIDIDKYGKIHISHVDQFNNTVNYMTNSSGTWVYKNTSLRGWNAITIDAEGKAFILQAYYDQIIGKSMLTCETNHSGSWYLTTIDVKSGSTVYSHPAVATDIDGAIHVAYEENIFPSLASILKYAVNRNRHEENEPVLRYTGKWASTQCSKCSSDTAMVHTGQRGAPDLLVPNVPAAATMNFTGTGIRWISSRTVQSGKANVYIDDKLVTTQPVDLFSTTYSPQQAVFRKGGLKNLNHTIKIQPLFDKNINSKGYAVDIDAFEVIP